MLENGKRNIAYFTNYGIYGRKYFPQLIPTESLTHIMYAFADVKPETGEVVLTDKWSDVDIHYEGDSWNEQGLFGNFKAIYLLKKKNRNLKVLISIGGWSYREHFHQLTNPDLRSNFVSTAVKIVEDVGIDGIDIDWEYPVDDNEAQAFVALLAECRRGLDELAASKGSPQGQYELSIAAPCGDPMKTLRVGEMDQYLDFWNLMAYDFAGSWSDTAGHQAALYAENGPSGDQAVQYYLSQGVPSQKLVLGLPLYGRAFLKTDGIGKPFDGVGQGTLGDGQYDYRSLPPHGAKVHDDAQTGTSYCYDHHKKELISYDTPAIAYAKAQYINDHGLGGAMFWELSDDILATDPRAGEALVPLMGKALGELQWKDNELNYPGSQYGNLRAGMN